MKILLSNDDGIRAPGIRALHRALLDPDGRHGGPLGAELVTVAPLTVQSATSHGVTFNEPIMTSIERVDEHMEGIAVDARPADCVKLALSTLWPQRFGAGEHPDVVISGMNAGANCGINVIYSGTVAAALEAAFLGVPSIAVSLHLGGGRPDFARGADLARMTIDRLLAGGLPERHVCLNVNIPVCDDTSEPPTPDEPEIVVCPMNTHGIEDAYERRETPRGEDYYWSVAEGLGFRGADPGTDVEALLQRKITVTPLAYDLTRYDVLDAWRERVGAAAGASGA